MTADDDFQDVLASLRWAAELPLAPEQRSSLKEMCLQIAGISEAKTVPLALLLAERERRREAEKRVQELEQALKAGRSEIVFRRRKATVVR